MGFTTECLIRKNTRKIRRKLSLVGYENDTRKMRCITTLECYYGKRPRTVTYRSDQMIECALKQGFIDCGDNEDLFFAIAALRDDTDIFQWFTDGEKWVISDIHHLLELKEYFEEIGFDYSKTHKATVGELISHFNNNL